jgi:DNA-binding GntR family transcriptional regulator
LREGELDFERRSHRLQAIVDAVLERDVEKALPLLEEDIRDELRTVFSVK